VGNTTIGNYLAAYYDGSVPREYAWGIVGQSEDISTLSHWGLIIFIVFAGLGAVYYLRRQKRADN
jgi:hypothetical protein